MTGYYHRVFAWFLTVLLLAMATLLNAAQDAPPDVRIVIDISGSMKKNDPHNLRIPAVNLLIDLLPPGSRAGIWLFGQQVNLLAKHQQVDDAWRALARKQASKIDSSALFTNIGAALEQVGYDLQQPAAKGHVHLIFLTDGLVDISKDPVRNQAERERILDKILPRYKQAGVTIHTIALSTEADAALLKEMARMTGGISATAHNAEELLKLFLQALEQAAPVTEVPLADNRFAVDSSIEEFTLLAMHPAEHAQVRLLAPDGTVYDADTYPVTVSWHRDHGYDLVTVRQPAAGDWVLQSDPDPSNRVRVVSNLKLKVEGIPGNLTEVTPIKGRLWLEEAGKPLVESDFLRLLRITAQLSQQERPLGVQQIGDAGRPPADGIYELPITGVDLPGSYEVLLKVDGKSFVRQYRQRILLAPPALDNVIDVQLPADAFAVRFDQPGATEEHYRLEVTSRHPEIDLATVQAKVMIHPPHHEGEVRDLPKQSASHWRLDLTQTDLPEAGQYRLALQLRGKTRQGAPFTLYPDEVIFTQAASKPAKMAHKRDVSSADDASSADAPRLGWTQIAIAAGVFVFGAGGIIWFIWRRYRKSVAAREQEVFSAVKKRQQQQADEPSRQAHKEPDVLADTMAAVDEIDAGIDQDDGVVDLCAEQMGADELDKLVDDILAEEKRSTT